MENKKKLNVGCAICDVRHVTEETLAAYEQVSIGCATLITSPEAQALLGRYQVSVGAASVMNLDGNARLSTTNGVMCLTPNQTIPEEKAILIVNGSLDIAPGCQEVLKNYAAIMVNGFVDVPESMAGLLAGVATVNGSIRTYPDGAIRLKSTTVLDRTFPLRAKQDALYYAASRIIALNEDIDFGKLAEKGVRFSTNKLVVAEGLVEAALPLFDEKADIQILPDGCAYLDDDAELTEALVRRRGGKLYVDGDLTILEDGPWLDQVSYLRVDGDVLAAQGLEDRLEAMDAVYQDLYLVGGVLLKGKADVTLTRSMLENAERGLSLTACASVAVNEDVPAQLLREKLVSVIACTKVICSKEQQAAIEAVAHAVTSIGPRQDEDEENEKDPNVVEVGAAFYTL